MKNGLNPTIADAEVDGTCIAASSSEQIDEQMHITQSDNYFENYKSDAKFMVCTARIEIKDSIALKSGHVYLERTKTKDQTQMK